MHSGVGAYVKMQLPLRKANTFEIDQNSSYAVGGPSGFRVLDISLYVHSRVARLLSPAQH